MAEEIRTFLLSKEMVISDDLLDAWYGIVNNSFQNKAEFKNFIIVELSKYKKGDN